VTLRDQTSEDQTEIILKTDLADLTDIYFGTRQHVYFFGPNTKGVSFRLVITLILFPFIAIYSLKIHAGGLFIFSCLCLCSAVLVFGSNVRPIITWKRSVNTFLIMAGKVKNLRIIFNEDFILHIQDEERTKLNWEAIKYVTVNDRAVSIHSDITNILLPKSSMTAEEYIILCNKIQEKVQVTKN
jgi:hypothetical protein